MKHIQIITDRLKAAQLKLKKSKCAFFKKELHYLGHFLTTEGIKPQLEKVKSVHAVPPPISKGDTADSTAITQQPPPHTTCTSPIQGASG